MHHLLSGMHSSFGQSLRGRERSRTPMSSARSPMSGLRLGSQINTGQFVSWQGLPAVKPAAAQAVPALGENQE
eukprot:6759173-Karenia_brevis.AAC.1